jgi:hypothetical protein
MTAANYDDDYDGEHEAERQEYAADLAREDKLWERFEKSKEGKK